MTRVFFIVYAIIIAWSLASGASTAAKKMASGLAKATGQANVIAEGRK